MHSNCSLCVLDECGDGGADLMAHSEVIINDTGLYLKIFLERRQFSLPSFREKAKSYIGLKKLEGKTGLGDPTGTSNFQRCKKTGGSGPNPTHFRVLPIAQSYNYYNLKRKGAKWYSLLP